MQYTGGNKTIRYYYTVYILNIKYSKQYVGIQYIYTIHTVDSIYCTQCRWIRRILLLKEIIDKIENEIQFNF